MRKRELTPEIIQKVVDVYTEIKDIAETKDTVNNILNINLTDYNINQIVEWIDSDIEEVEDILQELNDDIVEKQTYETIEEKDWHHYLLTHASLEKTYKLKVSFVDNIFKDYSKHGNNLTGEEILRKYKIKPEVWSLIKTKLRLYKASDVISPFTAETLSEEELDIKIEEAIDENISRTKEKMIDTYDVKFTREAKKAMKIAWNFEYKLWMLKEVIKNYKPKDIKFTPEKPKNNDEVTVLFSDIHLGKKDTSLIANRIWTMTNDLLNRPESVINMVWLWDYVETIVEWGMHQWQIEHMEWPFGFNLIMEVVTLIENMLLELHKAGKQVSLYGIAWNHDRLTADYRGDQEKTW